MARALDITIAWAARQNSTPVSALSASSTVAHSNVSSIQDGSLHRLHGPSRGVEGGLGGGES